MAIRGRIGVPADQAPDAHSEAFRLLAGASEHDLIAANRRFDLVKQHLEEKNAPHSIPARTLRFWIAQYRLAKEKYGNGYVVLLPKTGARGNRTSRLPEESRKLLIQFVETDYEDLRQETKIASWEALKRKCDAHGDVAPSYVTFCLALRERPAFEQTLKRKVRRAAYAHAPFYFQLEPTTPSHGDRPFEIGHIDHTELDVEVVCSHTGRPLGRPWMTILTDAFSKRCLALYLTFDAPSYRSCMMILRDCVRRNGRLHQVIVIDGGAEFQSTYFETLLARYECTKKTRPPAKARFGSVCERLFGTANTQFIHNLRGNTQITRNVRQVTRGNAPVGQAAWTLGCLYDYLSTFLFEIYDTIGHPALGQSPRDAYLAGADSAGFRPNRVIAYDQAFLMATLPTTPRGIAKVSPGRGIIINAAAHEAYLRGEYAKAVQIDPGYAAAFAALANQLYIPGLYGIAPPQVMFPRIMQAASRALELDPTLASAHAALALSQLHQQWKWVEPEGSFRRAVSLDPANADVRHFFSHFLLWTGRAGESAQECDRAVELDPFNSTLIACQGWHALYAGGYDRALAATLRAITFDENDVWALAVMGWAYEAKGMFQEALSAAQKSRFNIPMKTASIAHMFARSGNLGAAQKILEDLLATAKKKYVSAYDIAVVYAGLDNQDQAFEWLNKATRSTPGSWFT